MIDIPILDKALDLAQAHWAPVLTGLSGVLVGFYVDIGKEHLKRKIRLREEHEAEIRKEILEPIYLELKRFYLPICDAKELPVEYQTLTITKTAKNITEDSYGGVEPVVIPRFSRLSATQGFERYFDDAIENHHPKILREWGKLDSTFSKLVTDSVEHTNAIANSLKKNTGLPFLGFSVHPPRPGVNHERLAVLIFQRQLGMEREALRLTFDSAVEARISTTQEVVIRTETIDQLNEIVHLVDEKSKDKSHLAELQADYRRLSKKTRYIIQELDIVLAGKPRLKKCPLV